MNRLSPLAPASFPAMAPVPGVRLATAQAGIKHKNRADVLLAELAPGTVVAGVLTRSLTASAPVDWCRKVLEHGVARAILVNSGNANAFTGRAGVSAVRHMARTAAAVVNCRQNQVLLASTGVIGEPLPVERIERVGPKLTKALRADCWQSAAEAITTTDTFPKGASVTTHIGDAPVTISGIAKGSGMIAPDMATMLAFVFTDADIAAPLLHTLLKNAANKSFNCITVDSDTSTSDTLLLAATGRAGNERPASPADYALRPFRAALQSVLTDLATQVVKDGEGASKFIVIDVHGAASSKAARRIGLSIANSPLVKTAIAGEDANWGRIVMAVGKSGEKADRDRLSIAMGGVVTARRGQRVVDYNESKVAAHLKGGEVHIEVDVGIASSHARVWTCDLTADYIRINADYRT